MNTELLNRLLDDRASRRQVLVATNLGSGEQNLIYPGDPESIPEISDQIQNAFERNESTVVSTKGGEVFLHVNNPSLQLLIIGAVHIAQALVPMATIAGYQCTIIDPRQAFATDSRFPDAKLITEWPEDALKIFCLDGWTAVAALTHDPKIDDPALIAALNSDCFYIGALGSKRTHAKRCERLRAKAIPENKIGRIHGPIGLNINAVGSAEIAISIIGEITSTLRKSGEYA